MRRSDLRSPATGTEGWGSPLVEIERAVQERAKAQSIDMGRPAGKAALRALLDDEIQRWNADVKRGVRRYDLGDPTGVAERAWRNLAGYGPLGPLLADPDVWEIMINGPDQIFAKRHAGTSG
ncbi:MAG: hypothetical protein WKF86_05285, partial [Acidimicrobiales bacterium]